MKKNYSSIIGLILILLLNYLLLHFINKDIDFSTVNKINYLLILKQSLHLPSIYLLIMLFTRKRIDILFFTLFTVAYITLEFVLRYYNGKVVFEYNYVIGMFLGLLFTAIISYVFPYLESRIKIKKSSI